MYRFMLFYVQILQEFRHISLNFPGVESSHSLKDPNGKSHISVKSGHVTPENSHVRGRGRSWQLSA